MFSFNAQAHEARPLSIVINESANNVYVMNTKIPPSVPVFNHPKILMPSFCESSGKIYHCSQDISGSLLNIKYPQFNPAVSTLIRVHRLSGEKHSVLLGPKISTWSFPTKETKIGVASQYTQLGISHILGGVDHLLFLIGLLFIAKTRRRILIAITGFTCAHSITLILSALNLIRLPIAPVEAIIALSIVFVAAEIARGKRDTITYRYPIAVSSSFGLLHGFGFAAVLNEIGLPQTELLTGLLFFNVGVEIGQLIFVGGLVCLILGVQIVSKIKIEHVFKFERSIAYVLGILAVYWMFGRISNFI
jgi:hydrogenase/urease accessory protein HupE